MLIVRFEAPIFFGNADYCRHSILGLVDLVGAQHFYDSVRAAKKGRAPDGLPVVPEADTTTAGPAS